MSIKVICAWCNKDMGTKEGEVPFLGLSCPSVSHGICPECAQKVRVESKSQNAIFCREQQHG